MNKLHKQLSEGLFNEAFQTIKVLSTEDLNLLFNHFSGKQECINLLHQFFKTKPANGDYWFKLFLQYFKPEDIVWGIRCNRACFNKEYDTLFAVFENHPDLKVKTHYHFWKHLQPLIELGQEERESLFNAIEQKSLHEWLLYMALWYEEKRALLWKYDPSGISHSADTNLYVNSLSQFLDYLLHSQRINRQKTNNVDSLTNWVIEKVCREKSKGINPPEFELIDRWLAWQNFIATTLDSYWFDDSFDVELTSEGFRLFCNDHEKYFRWKVNGEKLMSWILKCEEDSWLMINKQIDEGLEVPGKTMEEQMINVQEFRMELLTENLLNYFNLKEEEEFPVNSLMHIINDFSFSGLKHWVNPLDQIYKLNADEWYKHIVKAEDDILADEDYHKIIEELKTYTNSKATEKFAEELLILDTEASYFKNYNPHHPRVNIYRTPFIKIHNTLFTFTAIIGEARSGLCLIENTLRWLTFSRNRVLRKRQTDEMERKLADLFKAKGWKNVACGLEYKNGVQGDFDVLVYDNGIVLMIELKRSQLRFTLEEALNEKVQSIEKAARQLQKGKTFIEANTAWVKQQLGLKEEDKIKEICPLIVSTSFENDHEVINGVCKKIALFELEEILNGSDFKLMRNEKLNPLGEIIKMIELEYMAWEIIEEVKAGFKAPGECTFYFTNKQTPVL